MLKQKNDIFDRMMHLPVLHILEPFYLKYKEVLLYLFFGGLTTVISIASYAFFQYQMGMDALIANVFSWVLAVLFAYVTNRIWVFDSQARNIAEILTEMGSFFGGRVATLLVEEAILFVFIHLLHANSMVVKIAAQIIVVVLNYIISKLLVFRSR